MSSIGTGCLAVLLAGCAAAPAPQPAATAPTRARPGSIEAIAVVDDHATSNPADDTFIGLVVGGLLLGSLLFDHGTGIVVGAENDAWASTEADGNSSRLPRYQVRVRFDDGGAMMLEYRGAVPFHRSERVVLTHNGLVRTDPSRPRAPGG